VSNTRAATHATSATTPAASQRPEGRGTDRRSGSSKKTNPQLSQVAASGSAADPQRGQLAVVNATCGFYRVKPPA